MIGFIATFLLARRPGLTPAHAKRVAKVIVLVGGVVLLAAAIAAWLHFHDRSVIENHTNAGNAEFREKQNEAERSAGAAKEQRDTTDAADSRALQEKVDEANDAGGSAADDVWASGLFDD